MEFRIAGIEKESIVDGVGIRFVIFFQGCLHNCKGCHNPETHSLIGGYCINVKKIIQEFDRNKLLTGITFSGGEPFLQASKIINLAKYVRENGKTVWVYTGFVIEELLGVEDAFELLRNIDVLVDGKFIKEQKDLRLRFRGSRNQRIIDMNKYWVTGDVDSSLILI